MNFYAMLSTLHLLEFSSENFIPDFASDTKGIVSINIMMLVVISLHFFQVFNEWLTMVNVNVGHIIANVSDDESDSKNSSKVSGKEPSD